VPRHVPRHPSTHSSPSSLPSSTPASPASSRATTRSILLPWKSRLDLEQELLSRQLSSGLGNVLSEPGFRRISEPGALGNRAMGR